MNFPLYAAVSFVLAFLLVPLLLRLGRALAFFTTVQERECVVFELFGKVRLALDEPGLHFPWLRMGPFAALVPFFGQRRHVDLRLDQTYLRSQAVNSEEGAPMGIGVWCEMYVSDPVSYLYRNIDPRGSLRANIANATVRSLSNMKLERMLEDRHAMSHAVREEVSEKSQEWGFKLGSVYIRKVHFRDEAMISQIEQKVVNRLRQVTAAIQQDGVNRVNVIGSTAERQAAIEFARAAAMRPEIVGAALAGIASEPAICEALFEVLETQRLLDNPGLGITLIPVDGGLLAQLAAARTLDARP